MEIGKKLQIAREAIGYTLEKSALESGIGKSSICEFEKEKRAPKFAQLVKLAKIYHKTVEFFLSDQVFAKNILLWRCKPDSADFKETEAKFTELCEQYHKLELIMNEKRQEPLPSNTFDKDSFDFSEAEKLGESVCRIMELGDIPSASLKKVLEERYFVKVFHLPFSGSTISTVSPVYGPAVLLNSVSREWRRNFDLAHELFHLITWKSFRNSTSEENYPSENEEKWANTFASRLLLPTDSVKRRIENYINNNCISLESLDEIAREYSVSLEALLWRLISLYRLSPDKVKEIIEGAKENKPRYPARKSDQPDIYPERYCSLAVRALNEGRLSTAQFAKYMGLTYKKAQEYLREDTEELRDETIAIPVA